jgi:hypothetical protein
MEHVLDNPAWNALITGNKAFAGGSEIAKYFPKEVSPFVAIAERSGGNFNLLYDVIPFESHFIFIAPFDIVIPEQWTIVHCLKCLQMVFEAEMPDDLSDDGLRIKAASEICKVRQLGKKVPQYNAGRYYDVKSSVWCQTVGFRCRHLWFALLRRLRRLLRCQISGHTFWKDRV